MTRCNETPAWAALRRHLDGPARRFDLRSDFAADAQRFERLSFEAPHVWADLSKNWLDHETLDGLLQLAREVGLEAQRCAMFDGEPVNTTEGRSVLHTALRAPPGTAPHSAEVHAVLNAMLAYAERVRSEASGIEDVVNIGIGGSDLGPQMAVPALAAYGHPRLRMHFVANVDGHAIAPLLARLDPERTLFVVASKTFTTQETLANALTAKAWIDARGGQDIARHYVACTTNVQAAAAFGSTPASASGTGWAGVIRCGARSAFRSPSR